MNTEHLEKNVEFDPREYKEREKGIGNEENYGNNDDMKAKERKLLMMKRMR